MPPVTGVTLGGNLWNFYACQLYPIRRLVRQALKARKRSD
jgi:hypothetical protein